MSKNYAERDSPRFFENRKAIRRKKISCTLREDYLERLDKLSDAKKQTRSALIETAVKAYIDFEERSS